MFDERLHTGFKNSPFQHDAAFAGEALHPDVRADPEDAPLEAATGMAPPHAVDLPGSNLVMHGGHRSRWRGGGGQFITKLARG